MSDAAGGLTYEEALAALDKTLHQLEEGKLTLEEAIAAVARGREYLALCQRKLDEAKQKIETLPVHDDTPEEEPPHPASVAELRSELSPSLPSEPEIPF